MKLIRILLAAIVAVLGATTAAQVTTATDTPDPTPNYNDPDYWETRTEHPATCYKHTGNSTHGKLVDGNKAVQLYEFNQSWPGDHWELLVVKSGSVDAGTGDGPGNAVYPHPTAGQKYYGPLNGGDEQGTVSHWIVCKGTTPDPEPTEVSWTATNGNCDAPKGTLAVSYDANEVDYVGDPAGSYDPDTTVDGQFTAKQGYTISGDAGPFTHTFAVEGEPCEPPADLRLNLTAECAVGDTLYWRVTNDTGVDIPFTWNGPGANDGSGVATANSRTYFTTIDAGGANTTKIEWDNPSGLTDEKTKAHNNQPCVYHVSFEKAWDGAAPDLDGAVLLTAESSLGTATCTSDDGFLSCVYSTGDDLHVPFGETYTVNENLPTGWYAVSGVGTGFTGIDGFDTDALPDALVYDVADDRFCTSNPEAVPPMNLEKFCSHLVTNSTTVTAPPPQFVDPTCADRDVEIVDPNLNDDITYKVVEGSATPGQEVTVEAVAGDGIVLEGQTQWTHEFGEVTDDDCVLQGTPSSSIAPECGGATLTFTNTVGEIGEGYTGETIEFTYTVDDDDPVVVSVAPNDTVEVVLDFEEDSGVHTVRIGDGDPVLIESNCEDDEVAAAAPTFRNPTCANPNGAAVTLPTVEGVEYSIDGTPAQGATVTVTATAEDGFVLTGPTTWSETFATVSEEECSPPEPAIEVAAFSPVCQSDTPYIDYSITVSGTDADRATLTFIDNRGVEIRTDADLPLSGRVVYPGASPAPNPDWPGWKLNDLGLWEPDPSDANWREGLTIRVDVNPTAFGEVKYPPATEVCNQPPTNSSGGPTTTVASSGTGATTTVVAELPSTGSNSTNLFVTIGLALIAAGVALASAVRVRRPRMH